MKFRPRLALVLSFTLLVALATGCAAPRSSVQSPTAATPPAPAPAMTIEAEPPVDHAAIAALFDRVERLAGRYAEGIDLLALGDEVAGEERIAEASNGLHAAAQDCAAIEGCDLLRVLRATDALLERQSMELKRQAFRIISLESSLEEDLEVEPGTTSFITVMPEAAQSVALLRGADFRELIMINGPVNAALDDWLTWMRPMLIDSWINYQYLRPKIAPIYEEAGLPEALLFAMMATESGGKVHAYSRAGAAGPLQFMSSTGRRYGLGDVNGFDTRLDPVLATRANVGYLNDQFAALNNSLEKVLAAYNGGETRMARLQRQHGDTPLWDSAVYYSLPSETRDYVPRVLAAAWLFLHPEDYDLQFPTIDPATVTLTLRNEISLSELTICLGQQGTRDGWFRTLRNLNPPLGPGDRLDPGTAIEVPAAVVPLYESRCLEGDLLTRARALHDANYPEEPEMVPYTVRRGDTLAAIAGRHSCVSMRELAALNGIKGPNYVIHVGGRLKIPNCG